MTIPIQPSNRIVNVIGIDAGVHTGIAIYHRPSKKITFTKTMNFWKAYDYVKVFDPSTTMIRIEVPDSKRGVYKRLDHVEGRRKQERIAKNIGSNRREATLLAERFEEKGFKVIRCTPISHKWDNEQIQRHTGYKEKTSQHVRDAIVLCWQT